MLIAIIIILILVIFLINGNSILIKKRLENIESALDTILTDFPPSINHFMSHTAWHNDFSTVALKNLLVFTRELLQEKMSELIKEERYEEARVLQQHINRLEELIKVEHESKS